jgi:hypothetical protein
MFEVALQHPIAFLNIRCYMLQQMIDLLILWNRLH